MAVSSVRRTIPTAPPVPRLLATHAAARLRDALTRPRGGDRWPGGPLVVVAPGGAGASACLAGQPDDETCMVWTGPTLGRAIAAAATAGRLTSLAGLLAAARLVIVDSADRLGGVPRERAFADMIDVAGAAGTALCVSLERHPAAAALDPRLATRLSAGLVVWLPGAEAVVTRGSGPTLGRVVRQVARHWELTPAEVVGPSRRRAVAAARAAGMYLARRLTGKSLGRIGAAFGGRDHTTVLHGIRVADSRRKADPAFARELDLLATGLAGARVSRR